MANIKVLWDLPTKRKSGYPLSLDKIQSATLQISADLEANYVDFDVFDPTEPQETLITDIEPGLYWFKVIVLLKDGKRSEGKISYEVADTSDPEVPVVRVELA